MSRDDLEVRIGQLKKARAKWMDAADEIDKDLPALWADPASLKSPAMPGGIKMLIDALSEANKHFRQTLKGGADACRKAGNVAGQAAGLYAANEERGEQHSKRIMVNDPNEERPR